MTETQKMAGRWVRTVLVALALSAIAVGIWAGAVLTAAPILFISVFGGVVWVGLMSKYGQRITDWIIGDVAGTPADPQSTNPAWQEGFDAYMRGLDIRTNPYAGILPLHPLRQTRLLPWYRGWRWAKQCNPQIQATSSNVSPRPVEPFEPFAPQGDQLNRWDHLYRVFPILNEARFGKGWSWMNNSRCKYIELRIDMRSGHCIIRDAKGVRITADELGYQAHAGGGIPWPKDSE